MRLLLAGAAGFIGSTYVRYVSSERPDDEIVVLDKFTYAGRWENLTPTGRNVTIVPGDILNRGLVSQLAKGCDAIINFAAESHVDRSIDNQDTFLKTQVEGTGVLLDAYRNAGVVRYVQVSTDEVYGSISQGSATEDAPLSPSSPYSAAKAGADLLVGAHCRTYGTEAMICRGSNTYGPFQYPEKLIPLTIVRALTEKSLPVYGDGSQVRNWLYVADFVRAIDLVLTRGSAGAVYNVGGPEEVPNIDIVRRILSLVGRPDSLISYVHDRPGHDQRYSLSSKRIMEAGWSPQVALASGLSATVRWYRDHPQWWLPLVLGRDATRRRGRVEQSLSGS